MYICIIIKKSKKETEVADCDGYCLATIFFKYFPPSIFDLVNLQTLKKENERCHFAISDRKMLNMHYLQIHI